MQIPLERHDIPLERHAHSLRVRVLFVVNTNTTKGGMIYMQDYNTIFGVIVMRQNGCSFSVIQSKYHIGSGTAQRILDRFKDSGFTLKELEVLRNEFTLQSV